MRGIKLFRSGNPPEVMVNRTGKHISALRAFSDVYISRVFGEQMELISQVQILT